MKISAALLLFCLLFACKGQKDSIGEDTVVKVNDKKLTRANLDAILSNKNSEQDSLIITEHYIREWIVDNLLYEQAEKNITDKEMIDQLVQNYRESLVVYQYKEQLVNEKMSKDINREGLINYYEENKEQFPLDRVLIKGLFLKVPEDASGIDNLRKWYKSLTPSNVEQIEKYCLHNAVSYNYVVNNWIDINEVLNTWPINYTADEEKWVKENKYIEKKDDEFIYFLHITDYLLPGDSAPFEYAENAIKEMIINRRKTDFLKQLEEELYQKALRSGQIIFYNE